MGGCCDSIRKTGRRRPLIMKSHLFAQSMRQVGSAVQKYMAASSKCRRFVALA
jgi:hypothetical protein